MEQKFNLKDEIIENMKLNHGFHTYYSKYRDMENQSNPDKIQTHCIFHNDSNPSLQIDLKTGYFNCFGCGKKGDIFNFRMLLEKIDFSEALKRFAAELNINYPKRKKTPALFTSENINTFTRELFDAASISIKAFLNNRRGLTDDILRKFNIGFSKEHNAVAIPFYDEENKLACTKLFKYNMETGEKEVLTYGKASLFGLDILNRELERTDRIFITEGEMDAMVLNRYGFTTVSGGSGAATWKKEWSEFFRNKEIIICYDSDDPGRKGAIHAISSLIKVTDKIKRIDLFGDKASGDMKDVTDFFIKAGNNKDDFLKLVETAPYLCPDDFNDNGDFINKLKQSSDKIKINAPQDFVNNIFYYGIEIDDEKYILDSRKNYDEIKDGRAFDMTLCSKETDIFRFSGKGILKFIEGADSIDPSILYLRINKYIRKYIFLKDEGAYALLTLWVMGTYVYRLFNYYPYIHLNAEKSSGKTLLMEVLAPICFNGQITVNSTESVIFRDIQNNSLTLFLDEVEKMGREDKDRYSGIMSILRTGFNKSGMVKRCDGKNKDKIRSFSTYSPKMFAGINDIEDVLKDRIIKIRMFRKLENEITERYTLSADTPDEQRDIRDDLYIFGLTFAEEISDYYNSEKTEIPDIEHLNNREFDIWLPIYVLSGIIDRYMKNKKLCSMPSINSFSRKFLNEKQQNDETENDTAKFLTVLNRMISEIPAIKENDQKAYYSTDSVLEYFKKQEEYSWLESKIWLTKRFKTIEIRSEVLREESKTYRAYVIDKSSFNEYLSRYTAINRIENLEKSLINMFDLKEVVPF